MTDETPRPIVVHASVKGEQGQVRTGSRRKTRATPEVRKQFNLARNAYLDLRVKWLNANVADRKSMEKTLTTAYDKVRKLGASYSGLPYRDVGESGIPGRKR